MKIKNQNLQFKSGNSIFYFLLSTFCVILFSIFYFLLSAPLALAARLYFEPQELTIGTQGEFSVAINIDAVQKVNAFSLAVSIFGPLIPFDINEANSVINFWVEKPNCDETTRLLTFSGITPGGFQGEKGRLLVIKFKAEKEGTAVLSFDKEKTKVFLHTPDAIEDSLILEKMQLPIVKGKENLPVQRPDNDPPEEFTPHIAADPTVFESKWFLVFSAQDKGSGIDHYEVCEGKRKCVVAESPYLLQNQNLDREIVVKAIDKSGNERIAVVEPKYPIRWYENWRVWGIIILVIIFGYILWKIKRRKLSSI